MQIIDDILSRPIENISGVAVLKPFCNIMKNNINTNINKYLKYVSSLKNSVIYEQYIMEKK